MLGALVAIVALLLATRVHGNVEKVIFSSPHHGVEPGQTRSALVRLTPSANTLSTQLPASFGSGNVAWFLLDALEPGVRHEVRVCWPATQPCSFRLETYTPQQLQHDTLMADELQKIVAATHVESVAIAASRSFVYLRLHSTADFFTLNKTLMRDPPRVSVDLILDPYLFNAVPRSLLPTIFYIVGISVLAWVASGRVWSILDKKDKRE